MFQRKETNLSVVYQLQFHLTKIMKHSISHEFLDIDNDRSESL